MKDIILFCSGGFAGMAVAIFIQILGELGAFTLEDEKEERRGTECELRDNEEVSILSDKYYD